MNDVTIPADLAGEIADFLMRKGLGRHHRLVALLGQPSSLKREVRDAINARLGMNVVSTDCADAVLSVVRRHVEEVTDYTLPWPGISEPPRSGWVRRDDVLRLLGDSDE